MPARRWSEACSRLRSRLRSTRRQRLGWIRTIFIGGCEAPVSSMVAAFQGIVGLTVFGSGAARAAVRLPSEAKQGSGRFRLHPVMVDIALQALGATKAATDLAGEGSDESAVVLPVRLAGIRVYGDVTEGVCAIGTLMPTSSPDRFVGRVMLTGADGQVLLDIDEIDMVVLRAPEARNGLASHMFTLEWEPVDLDKPTGDVDAVLLVGDHADGDRLLSAVRSGLSEHTTHCHVVSPGDEAQLRGALTRKDVSWNAIVVVCPPRPVDEALSDSEQLELAQSRTLLITDIVKTLSQIGARNSPRLWIVTRGAQQLDAGDGVTLAQTTLRGIARVLTFEHPELKPTIVDVDADGSGSATALINELLADPDHDEVALRDGQRYREPAGARAYIGGRCARHRATPHRGGSWWHRRGPAADRSTRAAGCTVSARGEANTAAGRPGRGSSRGRGAQLRRCAQGHGLLSHAGRSTRQSSASSVSGM